MAQYGKARYGEAYYDGYTPPVKTNTKMAKIKLNLSDRNPLRIIQYGKNVHTGLTGNAYVLTPAPTLVALLGGITALETANDAYEAEKDILKAKMAARDAAVKALVDLIRAEAVTVQAATGGDAAKILSTGYEVAASPTPTNPPGQVQNLRVTASDHEGALKASWKRPDKAVCYELQASIDPPTATSWTGKGSFTKTSAEVNSFTSG
jgi:hypothetical protein